MIFLFLFDALPTKRAKKKKVGKREIRNLVLTLKKDPYSQEADEAFVKLFNITNPKNSYNYPVNYTAKTIASLLASEDRIVYCSVAQILSNIGTPAVKPLVKIIKDKNSPGKEGAIEALSEIKTPEAIDALIDALKSDDMEIYIPAAAKLLFSGLPQVIEPLQNLFIAKRDVPPRVKEFFLKRMKKIAEGSASY